MGNSQSVSCFLAFLENNKCWSCSRSGAITCFRQNTEFFCFQEKEWTLQKGPFLFLKDPFYFWETRKNEKKREKTPRYKLTNSEKNNKGID